MNLTRMYSPPWSSGHAKEQVCMPRLIPVVFVLALVGLCLTEQDGLAQRGRGGAPSTRETSPGANTAVYPPLFFREDFKFDKTAPNVNDEREPEHVIVAGDVASQNLEVRVYGDKAGMRTVTQPYNKDITYMM